jgi:endonuclease/exonuclease/phosphatase (EEP) superfamily protein YafD
MGLCLPWRPLFIGEATGPRIRVLTCNVHYRQIDPFALRRVIAESRPDVVALQYWEDRYRSFLFDPADWNIRHDGQFLLASRYPITSAETLGHPRCAVRYEVDAPLGRLHFVNLHLETPRDGLLAVVHKRSAGIPELETNIQQRRDQSAAVTAWVRRLDGPLLFAGDFNTPTESAIYRDYWSGYVNAFSVAGFGWGETQFTPRRTAVRIDHLLAGPGWRCRECWVGPFVGSEHRPVFAEWEWVGE